MPALLATGFRETLMHYKNGVDEELGSILSWWMQYMPDQRGGFYGSVSNDNEPDLEAVKGIVLNSRILWTFSAAYCYGKNDSHFAIASRAFDYINLHFVDKKYGGVCWSVDANTLEAEGRKQIYGQAFCIYGMAEYYKASGNKQALQLAKDLFLLIERYSFDHDKGGYIEAFTREWQAIDDLRLSEKDENEKKTMNTHLHIIEAYANLYSIWPDELLREKISGLLDVFERYFISRKNQHLHLFMDESWQLRSTLVSFGHDIEAAWLLLECAEVIDDKIYIDRYKTVSIAMAKAASRGRDSDGGLWYEYDPLHKHRVKEKHSWPQAEAMVGFFNAWQLTGDPLYLQYSMDAFDFVQTNLKDIHNGEWYWGIHENGSLMNKEKAGFWKCPYHSARACMEISKRVTGLRV